MTGIVVFKNTVKYTMTVKKLLVVLSVVHLFAMLCQAEGGITRCNYDIMQVSY